MKEPTRAEWIAGIKTLYGIDFDALSKEEKIQFIRDREDQWEHEKAAYLARLKTPNRDSVRKLHQKDISRPDFLAEILDCLRDEVNANSFEGMEIARPEQFIDPVAEGYVSKDQLEIYRRIMNARGIWANWLTGKLMFLFGLSSKNEHENLRYALSIGVELMQFARDNPNDELWRGIKGLIVSTNEESARKCEREARRGAKDGVKEVFRERDNKPRRAKGEKSAYDAERMADCFGVVDAMMKAKAGRGRIGEALNSVYESEHLHKITFERFRRAYYKSKSGK